MTIKVIQSVRGMHDCLPKETVLWQKIEKILISILDSYGYNEIRFPIIEFTQLFKRSIGQITDVIEKEMYSFYDKSNNDLSLRPEGTSGCVRAGIEHSLFYHQKQRLWYLGPMFRHERPQRGRYRQFHQFSAETFGYAGPNIDVELILIIIRCWKALKINQYVTLELNSIGSFSSREAYKKQLIKFFLKNSHYLDHNDINRLNFNPLRFLDTKNIKIQKLLKQAPVLQDYLDNDSQSYFNRLCQLLDLFNVSYIINPYLVRGLDYYNDIVFEWTTHDLGIKKTICAGGRYDELIRQLSGTLVPAVGFAIGLERLLLLMKTIKNSILDFKTCVNIYIIYSGKGAHEYAMMVSELIHDHFPHLRLMIDYGVDHLKKQFSRAMQNNSMFVVIINEINVLQKTLVLKDLKSGTKDVVKCSEIVFKLSKLT